MNMFENYDNLSENYIPNNSYSEDINKEIKIDLSQPIKFYNIKNEFIGYSICQGETCNLPVNIIKEISVPCSSIIFNESGEGPDEKLEGVKFQKAYNTSDFISWTCKGKLDDNYIWEKDECLIYPEKGDKKITLSPKLENFMLEINIQNFRYESIETLTFENTLINNFNISEELSSSLLEGIYYISIKLKQENSVRNIESYLLHIRNK